jgi:hypothetical protein
MDHTENTSHVIATLCFDVITHAQAARTQRKHCSSIVVTSLSMRKLHGHKENTAPVLLAVCALRALPSNGFTCRNKINWKWYGKKRPSANLRQYPVICLEGLKKIIKILSIVSVPVEIRTEHIPKTELLLTEPTRSAARIMRLLTIHSLHPHSTYFFSQNILLSTLFSPSPSK